MVLLTTDIACCPWHWAVSVVVWASALTTGLLGRVFLKRLKQSICLKQRIRVFTGNSWMSLLVHLILLASPLMGLGHFNYLIICELFSLGTMNKLSHLEVKSSMIKKVYLMWLLFFLVELVPSYQILYEDIQFSHGLLFALLDVPKVLIPGLQVWGAPLEAVGKCCEYLVWILLVFFRQLVLQGCPSLRCFLVTKEQDVCDSVCFGCMGDHKVLLEPLCVESSGRELVLSVPVHVGKHVWWYSSCPSNSVSVERKYFTLGV